jgi:GNAT superfamily N-acetyltransferase
MGRHHRGLALSCSAMAKQNPQLPLGYSPVGPARLANVVTCLEMTRRPPPRSARDFPAPYALAPLEPREVDSYRALFRKVGQDWMWYSRLVMPDAELRGILADPRVEIFALRDGNDGMGLLELDFREAGQCELTFFGLAMEAIGIGLGRILMETAIALAWSKPIERMWLHTCSFDHPSALAFYIRSGFRPYAFQVEVQPDPRLTGHMPRSAAPHIPLIEPESSEAVSSAT